MKMNKNATSRAHVPHGIGGSNHIGSDRDKNNIIIIIGRRVAAVLARVQSRPVGGVRCTLVPSSSESLSAFPSPWVSSRVTWDDRLVTWSRRAAVSLAGGRAEGYLRPTGRGAHRNNCVHVASGKLVSRRPPLRPAVVFGRRSAAVSRDDGTSGKPDNGDGNNASYKPVYMGLEGRVLRVHPLPRNCFRILARRPTVRFATDGAFKKSSVE